MALRCKVTRASSVSFIHQRTIMPSASPPSQLVSNLPNDPASGAYLLMPAPRNRGMVWLVIFGVLLPFASVGAEVLLRACSDTLFDPLPTIWHGLFAVSVPIINA